MSPHPDEIQHRKLFIGLETEVPLLNGGKTRYIYFDNAASTPPLKAVQETVNTFMNYYSSVHRGAGFKSQLSTHVYEEARHTIMRFVGADPENHTCVFGKNTTEAINKLARRFPFTEKRNLVITTGMEHHSNDLPWRRATEVVHVNLHADGGLNLDDFKQKLEKYADKVALVAVCGGSNVTGYITPIHELAEMTHAIGAKFMADCAQLAPHRKVDMRPPNDPSHLDYVTISAHKMYAPYGAGALIGRKDTFETGDPDMVGGGVVLTVSLEDVEWTAPPDREEAGSPNHVGAIAMAAAAKTLMAMGMDTVAAHEIKLTSYALQRLKEIPEVSIFGDAEPQNAPYRLGVIPFELAGINHFKVAAILGHEYGIGVRNGCFCARPLILHLLQIEEKQVQQVRREILSGYRSNMPGLTRASFGFYNTTDEIDIFIEALKDIVNSKYQGEYVQDKVTGDFRPVGWEPMFEDYFSLEACVK
jgi:cysteine desulfurase/selenocysteine lyase